MNAIIRFWNRNRKGIILGIVVIALLVLLIQFFNMLAKNKNNKKREEELELYEKYKDMDLPTQSVIGESSIGYEDTEKNVNVLNEFIEKCSNGKYQEAFDMLTSDCKDVLYDNSLQNFIDGYIKTYVSSSDIYGDAKLYSSTQKGDTYIVSYQKDGMLAGNTTEKTGKDYITVMTKEDVGKISIGSLLYRNEINKEQEYNGIKIIVIAEEVYKENVKYAIKVENNTNKEIMINTGRNTNGIYALGTNGTKYSSLASEIPSVKCRVPAGLYENYKIKFNITNSSKVKFKGIIFNDIVDDYKTYKENTEEFTNRIKISIEL